MPYWTLNGVDDGFGSWPNVSKPAPGASAVKDLDRIRRNFIFTVSRVLANAISVLGSESKSVESNRA